MVIVPIFLLLLPLSTISRNNNQFLAFYYAKLGEISLISIYLTGSVKRKVLFQPQFGACRGKST